MVRQDEAKGLDRIIDDCLLHLYTGCPRLVQMALKEVPEDR
jgi:hypothetical protein